jgi:hypothetical protein
MPNKSHEHGHLSRDRAVLLLVDHQVGIYTEV